MFQRSRILIKDIFESNDKYLNENITICGWVHIFRKQSNIAFIIMNDGSTAQNLMVVFDESNMEIVKTLKKGSSLKVSGKLIISLKENQPYELVGTNVTIYGHVDAARYPISKNKIYIYELEHKQLQQ
jgi:asparaginyl-tRNA synthetase